MERTEAYMLTQRSHTPGPDGKQAHESTTGHWAQTAQTAETLCEPVTRSFTHARPSSRDHHHRAASSGSTSSTGNGGGASTIRGNGEGTDTRPDSGSSSADTCISALCGELPGKSEAFTNVPPVRKQAWVGRTAAGGAYHKHPSLVEAAPRERAQRQGAREQDVVQGAAPIPTDKRERPYKVRASCGDTSWTPAEEPTVCRADQIINLHMQSCCAFPLLVATEVFLRTRAGVYQLDAGMRSVVRAQGSALLGRVALPDAPVAKSSLKTMEGSRECELLLATAEFDKQIGDSYTLILQATVHEAREGGHVWKWTFPLRMGAARRAGKRKEACGAPAPIPKRRKCMAAHKE